MLVVLCGGCEGMVRSGMKKKGDASVDRIYFQGDALMLRCRFCDEVHIEGLLWWGWGDW